MDVNSQKSPVTLVEGFFHVDSRGLCTYVSPSLAKLFHKDPKEIIGKEIFDFFKNTFFSEVPFPSDDVLRSTKPIMCTIYYPQSSDSTLRRFELSIAKDEEGLFRGTLKEITAGDMRHNENNTQNEQWYRDVVEHGNDIIYRINDKGNFLYINPCGIEKLGYSFEEFTKLNLKDVVPQEFYRDILHFFENQITSRNKCAYFESPFIKKDGRRIHMWQSSILNKNANGAYEFSVVGRDITEIKSLQEALVQTEEKYRAILDNMREGYYQTDLKGKIVYVNQALLNLTGYTANEMIGESYKKFFSKETAEKIFNLFHEVYTSTNPNEFSDWELIAKDGTKKSIAASIELMINQEGEKIGFWGMIFDLTDKKRFINALIDSERRLRDLVEHLPEIVFELDSQGNILYVNNRTVEVLGYEREELLGTNALNIVIPEQRDRAIRGLQNTLAGKKYTAQNYIFQGKHRQIPIHLYTTPMIESDIVVGLRGIAIDITNILEAEKHLKESHEKFRTMIENSSEIISIIDENGIIQFESQSITRILGYEIDERIGTNALEFIHEDDRSYIENILQKSAQLNHSEIARFEYRYRHKNGQWRYLESTATNLLCNPLINGILLNTRDITEKKIAEKAMEQREKKYSTLYNNALVAMLTIDAQTHCILQTNDLGFSFFDFRNRNDIIGQNFFDFFEHQRDAFLFLQRLRNDGAVSNFETSFISKRGIRKWAEISAKLPAENNDIDMVIIDISRRKETEEMLTSYIFYDQLTKLPNRDMFINKLKTEIIKSNRRDRRKFFAVMCVGLDRFKNINEMHGATIGDHLLQKIAEKLKTSFREDDLVARLDGDKFIILFSEIGSPERVAELVQKTYAIFADPFIVDGHVFMITISIGVSIFPTDGVREDVLMRNAERAMYQAKQKGRNTYCLYDEKLNAEIMKQMRIEEELRHAILRNEFLAFYQPQVRQDGFIIGMEALVRWNSPQRGMISPSEFIPIAEKTGMIEQIGNLILYESCMQNARWQAMGYRKVRVAVNLSAVQFNKPDIVSHIAHVLCDTRLDPKCLELEITESGIIQNEAESIEKLRELKNLGVSISIDDFGTGYSSLSKLRDFPIETLKIDKTFIDKIPADKKSSTIARTIIDLSHNLGFKVIAEGVETKEQFSFLLQNHCDLFQGYYFSKPLPAKDFEEKIKL
ncbi:MAG: PAS domain S-box protein [Spirochaetes bacterium]|nr:PAS domain S-box protein [Spirochaetota bacterium]